MNYFGSLYHPVTQVKESIFRPRVIEKHDEKFDMKTFCLLKNCNASIIYDRSQRIYSWGLGESGNLGHDSSKSYYSPKLIVALQNERILSVCGKTYCRKKKYYGHTLFLSEKKVCFGCGDNEFMQSIGRSHSGSRSGSALIILLPRVVSGTKGVVQIACGDFFSGVVSVSGSEMRVICFGKNSFGKLGNGSISKSI